MSVKTAATPGSETPKTAIRGYYDRANSDLLNRIPLTAQKVLELGCGAGALGAALKKRLPSVFYVGLELDPDAASIAQERLDEVAVFNADTDTIPTEITDHGPYDVVVFGDVLEHLRDPWTVMSNFVELLAPG
ncbi:MAG: class I SAM-dependent methyltransferase, partial [Pseudomonadota bacterium]